MAGDVAAVLHWDALADFQLDNRCRMMIVSFSNAHFDTRCILPCVLAGPAAASSLCGGEAQQMRPSAHGAASARRNVLADITRVVNSANIGSCTEE